jgi:hypothetical protein
MFTSMILASGLMGATSSRYVIWGFLWEMNTLEQMYRATYSVPLGTAMFKYHPDPPRTKITRTPMPTNNFFFQVALLISSLFFELLLS